jgi:CRAL/TRIO domain
MATASSPAMQQHAALGVARSSVLVPVSAAPAPRSHQSLLVLKGQFPERLSQLWFLNAPFIFWGLWRIVSPFIEVATREKIVFLTGAERTARLQEAIPPEVRSIVTVLSLQHALPPADDSRKLTSSRATMLWPGGWGAFMRESL